MQSDDIDREDGPDDEEELDLRTLPDDELVQQMHDDLYDGLKEEIEEGTNIPPGARMAREASPRRRAGRGHAHRRDRLPRRDPVRPGGVAGRQRDEGRHDDPAPAPGPRPGAATIGKVVIGTVKGDIHDIGKNLVGMMLEGAGFEVIDLGINTDADEFLAALEEHRPNILGMSALLTTTMPYMKVVIDTLKERGLRDEYTVLVGGAPLNEQFAEAVGADAYCRGRGGRGGDGEGLRGASSQPAKRPLRVIRTAR